MVGFTALHVKNGIARARTNVKGNRMSSSLNSTNHTAKPLIANSWADFLECVRQARADLGNPDVVWYRGMSSSNYTLLPSLLRASKGIEKEQSLFNEYQRSAARLTTPRTNDWELLFDMQHYGIPTRLLDWTDVLGVAIAFALYDSRDDEHDSSIHLLDPVALNKESGLSEVKRPTNDPNFDYKSIYWLNLPFKANKPIAIDGPFQNNRMVAQQGAFTVHGSESLFFENSGLDCLRKIVLTASAKAGAREFLEHSNLNAYSIYPDIVGMARHIVRKHLG